MSDPRSDERVDALVEAVMNLAQVIEHLMGISGGAGAAYAESGTDPEAGDIVNEYGAEMRQKMAAASAALGRAQRSPG